MTHLTPIVTMPVIHHCVRCGSAYDWRKSYATLKLTYCNQLCESADLGFDLMRATR